MLRKNAARLGAAILATITLFPASALAATAIVSDSAFGSASVLRDLDNNRDFLRLDLTMGYGYTGITGEFGSGGDFAGWSVASLADMGALGVSAGVTHGSTDAGQIAIAESLRDFFCPTGTCLNISSTHVYVRGLVSDQTSLAGRQDAFSIGRRNNVTPNEVDFRLSGFASALNTTEEVWLTRTTPAVPLPAPAFLLLGGLAGLGLFRTRRSH